MAKNVQAVEEKLGLFAQAQAEYDALVEEISDHFQQARKLREQAGELSGTDPQAATKVRQLLDQAEYFETLGNRKDGYEYSDAKKVGVKLEMLDRRVRE